MHKQLLNEITIYGLLEPKGPVLIKSGGESGADPSLPDMSFVRTTHPNTGEPTIYLPGSSLKGAIRSHVERIIRTVHGDDRHICCDPLGRESCGKYIEDLEREYQRTRQVFTSADEYRELCRACRIFGHTVHASHFISSDAYPLKPVNDLPVRHAVAIDRFSGSVAVGPFEMESASEGLFRFKFTLRNFENWQVGLIALTLRDIRSNRLLFGFGKSRGLGEMSLALTGLEISYPGHFFEGDFDFENKLYGMSGLNPGLVKEYDLVEKDIIALPQPGTLDADSSLWGCPTLTYGLGRRGSANMELIKPANASIWEVLQASVPAWAALRPGELS